MRTAALTILALGLAHLGGVGSAQAQTGPSAAPVCQGAPPVAGQSLHGPILHIPDAGVICVATGAERSDWVAVPLAQPAAARNVLMAAAFGKNATCRIGVDGRGECTVEGDRLASRLARTDVLRAAVSWR